MSQSVSFDRIADRYDATRMHPVDVAPRIAGALIQHGRVPEHGLMLEIGIGTGRIALPLLARGISVTGVDISSRMVERLCEKYAALRATEPARSWGELRVELADMTQLPFADASFDAVVAVHVLHLVLDWRHALDEALRVVKPGGALLIGQDVTEQSAVILRVQDEWLRLLRKLGYEPVRVGAASTATVLDELRRRGLEVRETPIVSWKHAQTPRAALMYIANREWSRTWDVPDDIFTRSIAGLTTWAEQQFGDAMDVPRQATFSFKLATAIHP